MDELKTWNDAAVKDGDMISVMIQAEMKSNTNTDPPELIILVTGLRS